MKSKFQLAERLVDFIYKTPTAYHAVDNCRAILLEKGFVELNEKDRWVLEKNKGYFVQRNNSAFVAFITGDGEMEECGFKIGAAHGDSPSIKIKPAPEMVSEKSYLKLNVEIYGGPILNTWLDRPLSLAGRVVLKTDDSFNPEIRLININEPLMVIPNLAIHMNSTVNKGIELGKQVDMIPLLASVKDKFVKDNYLLNILARELSVQADSILDFDLYLYEYDKGTVCGLNNEFISSPRIDNLQSLKASLEAFQQAGQSTATRVLVSFDNEEVGSATRQGAHSNMLKTILQRVSLSFNKSTEDFYRALQNSYMLSLDCAHAVHPSRGEKSDPSNRPVINKGPALKVSANQSYTSDGFSSSLFKSIADAVPVDYQIFVNRSDMRGGSTIGPVSAMHLDIPSVDAGIPILAMHSIRELCGVDDHYSMVKLMKEFFK